MPPTPKIPAEPQSHANYEVLVQLKDSMEGMGQRFDRFATQQEEENRRLHLRIDATQERFVATISTLKDGMAERGRITPAIIASGLSIIAILCGAGGAYVTMRVQPLEKSIAANTSTLTAAETQRQILMGSLQDIATESAVTDAHSETDRAWIVKLLDEVRSKPHIK